MKDGEKEWLNLIQAAFKETYLLFVSTQRKKTEKMTHKKQNIILNGKYIQKECTTLRKKLYLFGFIMRNYLNRRKFGIYLIYFVQLSPLVEGNLYIHREMKWMDDIFFFF